MSYEWARPLRIEPHLTPSANAKPNLRNQRGAHAHYVFVADENWLLVIPYGVRNNLQSEQMPAQPSNRVQ
jgi:hypothetical protein